MARFDISEGSIRRTIFQAAERELLTRGNRIVTRAKQLAPKDTGQLADSIRLGPVKTTAKGATVEISADAKDSQGHSYAAAVEFGRRPGAPLPPYRAGSRLHRWAGSPRRGVFGLAKAIADKGIEPRSYLGQAFEEERQIP